QPERCAVPHDHHDRRNCPGEPLGELQGCGGRHLGDDRTGEPEPWHGFLLTCEKLGLHLGGFPRNWCERSRFYGEGWTKATCARVPGVASPGSPCTPPGVPMSPPPGYNPGLPGGSS